ncbi:MAG TPA: hypothetical protein VK885_03105 [Desulfotignum sp.]|nr:hypothetical protein [Desulfotignum sp.]
MNLTVCFKIIPDYEMVPVHRWEVSGLEPLALRFVRQAFNCYEESALEMALALGETGGSARQDSGSPASAVLGENRVARTALTVDDERADLFLRHLLAVGYDRAVRVAPDQDLRFFPGAVARIIAAAVNRFRPQDLVILGPRGGEGDHCQTGPLVAELLGWPCLMGVSGLALTENGLLEVRTITDRAHRIYTVAPPLVLVTGHALDFSCLRVPTLNQKLSARKKPVETLLPADLGLSVGYLAGTDPLPAELILPAPKQTCTRIEGADPREKARNLFDRYLKSRLVS